MYTRNKCSMSLQINYERRMGNVWVNDLQKLRTNWEKPYLETAPYLIIVFKQPHSYTSDGQRRQHYYSEMSVCISVGLMLAAVQVQYYCTPTRRHAIDVVLGCFL